MSQAEEIAQRRQHAGMLQRCSTPPVIPVYFEQYLEAVYFTAVIIGVGDLPVRALDVARALRHPDVRDAARPLQIGQQRRLARQDRRQCTSLLGILIAPALIPTGSACGTGIAHPREVS